MLRSMEGGDVLARAKSIGHAQTTDDTKVLLCAVQLYFSRKE